MAIDTSEKMLNNYKEEFYEILNQVIAGNIGNLAGKKQLASLKTKITRTLSYSSGEERKELDKLLEKELACLDNLTKKGDVSQNISREVLEELKQRYSVVENQNEDSKGKDNFDNNKTNDEKKEDLNKIHIRKVNELEETLKGLNLKYEDFMKNRGKNINLEEEIDILNNYINEFNLINKELTKIASKTSKNTKNVLPNVQNEDDRKKWEQENKELLNKINSLIPDVKNPLLNLKKEIATIQNAMQFMQDNKEVIYSNDDLEEETPSKAEENSTEEKYYEDLANQYVAEQDEEVPYELFDEYVKNMGDNKEIEQDKIDTPDISDEDTIEQNENDMEDVSAEEEIEQDENDIEKRIQKYINFSKLHTKKDFEDKLNEVRDVVIRNIEESPKKYREIRKVFKRIYYDDLEFNGDVFVADLFNNGEPQYLGGKLSREDFYKFEEGIELYKNMSIEGKIPQNEVETFDKFVLAPYELKVATIEKSKEKVVEENDMMKDLKSQTVNHEQIDENDFEIIDEADFEIVDDFEIEDEDLKR